MWEILSIITAMEESDGQDSSMVWRLIVIMSNERRNPSVDLWNGKGLKGKVASLGIEPRATSALPLSYDARRQPPPLLARVRFPAVPLFLSSPCRFKGLWTVTVQIASFIRHDYYWSSNLDHRGVLSIGLIHSCDYAYNLSHLHVCICSMIHIYVEISLTNSEWLLQLQ